VLSVAVIKAVWICGEVLTTGSQKLTGGTTEIWLQGLGSSDHLRSVYLGTYVNEVVEFRHAKDTILSQTEDRHRVFGLGCLRTVIVSKMYIIDEW
jgi:hypothetical protein